MDRRHAIGKNSNPRSAGWSRRSRRVVDRCARVSSDGAPLQGQQGRKPHDLAGDPGVRRRRPPTRCIARIPEVHTRSGNDAAPIPTSPWMTGRSSSSAGSWASNPICGSGRSSTSTGPIGPIAPRGIGQQIGKAEKRCWADGGQGTGSSSSRRHRSLNRDLERKPVPWAG
jgi:hypothetical protein